MSKRRAFAGLLSDDEGSSSGSESGADAEFALPALKRPQKAPKLSVEQLQEAGYKPGPSILGMREQPAPEPEQRSWEWSGGQATITAEPETREVRAPPLTTSLRLSCAHAESRRC